MMTTMVNDDDDEDESSSSEEGDNQESDNDECNDYIVALSLLPPIEQYDVVNFPGNHASTPIESFSASQPNYNAYQQQLNSDNRYAPFVSQFDWEIARWAKLLGPSSVLTKLLQIKGVSGSLTILAMLLTCSNS